MADNFLQFLGGIGSTPPKVYGTSAEDVALRNQMASGANYWNNTRPSQTGYLPSLTGPSATNTGGAVYPWNSPSQMTPPTYGGNGAANPVQTTSRGGLNPATDKRLEHFLASEGRSVADLLAGIGSYGGTASLGQPTTAAGAAAKLAQGGAPKQGYAPWGAFSRSLAYNYMNPDPQQATANVQLPRARPASASPMEDALIAAGVQPGVPLTPPAAPVGANPGMGGAMIGNGQMASGIPPQGPPPAGIAPTVWAGDRPQQSAGRQLNISVLGGKQGQTGTAGGYQYVNGKKVGYAPQTIGGSVYTPTNGATAYGLANAAGQIAALNKQATATGSTGVYNYQNGVKTGTVSGGSSAQAYEKAAAKSRDKGTSGEGGNPSWW